MQLNFLVPLDFIPLVEQLFVSGVQVGGNVLIWMGPLMQDVYLVLIQLEIKPTVRHVLQDLLVLRFTAIRRRVVHQAHIQLEDKQFVRSANLVTNVRIQTKIFRLHVQMAVIVLVENQTVQNAQLDLPVLPKQMMFKYLVILVATLSTTLEHVHLVHLDSSVPMCHHHLLTVILVPTLLVQ